MMQNADVFRLAQLTDVHLGPLPPFTPRHWNVKRILGFINFRRNRWALNDPALVNRLVDDVHQQSFDHITVTGDLTNIGMPPEFIQSHTWLQGLGVPADVTVIPGNHDVYTRLRTDPGIERWRAYMSAREGHDKLDGLPAPLETGFPFVRTFGRFALIALNSSVYMPPAVPAGRVGAEQIARFVEISEHLHMAGFVRIVLIHHPPLPEHTTHRGLRDASAFEAALIDAGAELLIHGHNHRDMISWRDTATGPLPMVGAAAAADGRYNIYRLERLADNTCNIEFTTRGPGTTDGGFTKIQHKLLNPAKENRERII